MLADTFQFTGPVIGPLSKNAFLKAYPNVEKLYAAHILKSQCPAIFTIESQCMLTFENV